MIATCEISDCLDESETEKRELACGSCGYGIVVPNEPPACPMCRSTTWDGCDASSLGFGIFSSRQAPPLDAAAALDRTRERF